MTLAIEFHAELVGGGLNSTDWNSDAFDFWAFDRHADELFARREPLHVIAAPDEVAVLRNQLAIRTQRLAAHRNEHTSAAWFAVLLAEHRRLHDLAKPLVRADL